MRLVAARLHDDLVNFRRDFSTEIWF
jgi:hypothetical protein